MKLSFVELAGFRGFRDRIRVDLPEGFAVLTGRNGSGKSTILDAVDFALTGTISKYDVTGAKGGGLQDHMWWIGEDRAEDHYVSVGLVDEDGAEHVLTRSRTSGVEPGLEDVAAWLCPERQGADWLQTLMRTTLIRDERIASLSLDLPEQARFQAVRDAIGGLVGPDHSKRTNEVLSAANSRQVRQKQRLDELQAELGRALEELTEARSREARQPDVLEAEAIVKDLASDLVEPPALRPELLRGRVAEIKQSVSALVDAYAMAQAVEASSLVIESEEAVAEIKAAHADLAAKQHEKLVANERLAQAQVMLAAERERDAFVDSMTVLLNQGEHIGLRGGCCPLCGVERTPAEFAAAIEAARTTLESQGGRITQAATALEAAQLELEAAGSNFAESTSRLKFLDERRESLSRERENLATALKPFDLGAVPLNVEGIHNLSLQRQEDAGRLEYALYVLEASSAHDRVVEIELRIAETRAELEREMVRLTKVERAAATSRQIDRAAREVPNQVLVEQFDTVMPLLKELYRRLRPHADWREIETDFGGKVRASLNLTVADGHNPQFLFSSGQRRAAGVAFLLAIHLSRPWCRLRSLLLDDPVQHIDDYRALNLAEVLSAIRRTGRQVIVAVEDPTLADLLCRKLRSSISEPGLLLELATTADGSAGVASEREIVPLLSRALMSA